MSEERRSGLPLALGLGLVAVVAVVALAFALRGVSGPEQEASPVADGITASADFSPRVVLFGDTLTARIDATVDTSVVDPQSVEVRWDSAPWAAIRPPERKVERVGSTAHVGTTYVLRCLTNVCAPVRETERVDLEPAQVVFTSTAGGRRRESVELRWPTLVVNTRAGELDSTTRDALAAPWRADFVALPAVSYRVGPWLVIGLLVLLGVALLAAAGLLARRAWPHREAEPEPEPEPLQVASVLEQALELLETETAADGAEERRRALELVADEVEDLGDDALALSARELAWSPLDPAAERTRALAADLRVRFADVLAELEAERTNGAHESERVNGGPR